MEEMRVGLSEEALNSPKESIQSLIEASNAIANASEKDFEKMKNTKWYSRLWKMITFSKDNQKVMANGISNLAKLQEIVMKALLQLTEQNTELSEIVNSNSDIIEELCNKVAVSSKQQYAMLVQINRIKSGIEKSIFVDDLSGDSRIIVVNAVTKIADDIGEYNELSRKYISRLMATAEFTSADLQNDIDFSCIEELKNKEAQLLYRLCKEYIYICMDNFDYESEILEYINVNKKKAIAIENQILKLVKLAGKEALLNGLEEETYDYISDEYIEFEYDDELESDNDTIEVDINNIDIDELEVINITNIKHVNKNECLVYERKVIYFNSNISCEGDMEFIDCVVVYNDKGYGGIRLSSNASLKAYNTSFVCQNKSDKGFISNDSDTVGDILFEKCVFYDCSNFLDLKNVKSFRLCDSVMHNISSKFIKVSTNKSDICIDNIRIVQKKLKNFNVLNNRTDIFELEPQNGSALINNVYIFETDSFWGNSSFEKVYFKYDGAFFSGRNGILSNSRFVNVSNIVEDVSKIENCIFENCMNVCQVDEISNCVFIKCGGSSFATLLGRDANVSYCRFIDCIGHIYKNYMSDRSISYCEFIGCKNTEEYREIMIELIDSKIRNCVFECVDARNGFIIGNSVTDGDGIKVIVEDCEFINCASQRDSKKLIKQWGQYFGLFNKVKETKVVDVRNSQGWENVATKIGTYDIERYNDGKASHAGCLEELHSFNGIYSQCYEKELKEEQITDNKENNSSLYDDKSKSILRVGECFDVVGKGPVAMGKVEEGSFKVGDNVSWELGGILKKAKVIGIMKFRELLDEAHIGDEIGMVLDGVNKDDIQRGCIIRLI